MSQTCLKCGTATDDGGDIHCRKIFVGEVETLIAQREIDQARDIFISTYFDNRWKELILKKFGGELGTAVSAELNFREKQRREREAGERHKEYLGALGITYAGTSPASPAKRHRITHCYNCREYLDNSIDIECNTCRWIICRCGACGCGYSSPERGQ